MRGHTVLPKAMSRDVGKRLRALRLARDLTQTALSERVGLHRTVLGRIERGARLPSIPNLTKLAQVLRVRPCYFFSVNGDCTADDSEGCGVCRKLLKGVLPAEHKLR